MEADGEKSPGGDEPGDCRNAAPKAWSEAGTQRIAGKPPNRRHHCATQPGEGGEKAGFENTEAELCDQIVEEPSEKQIENTVLSEIRTGE